MTMTIKPINDPRVTAHHEAGHAVIGRVLTLKCGRVTIRPNYRELEAGFAITADPYACIYEWERRGKARESGNAVWIGRAITFMAGAEAAAEFFGARANDYCGDEDDRHQVALMLDEVMPAPANWDKYEARLRQMTRMLVRRHRARIERVAEALLTKRSLSAKALDKLTGRSVDDVKVNAPFLRMMHARSAAGQAEG
jgi:hypothetical protein